MAEELSDDDALAAFATGGNAAPPTGGQPDIFDLIKQEAEAPAEVVDEQGFGTLEQEWSRLRELRDRKDRADAIAKDASKAVEAQKFRLLNAMKLQGTTQFRGEDGGLAVVATEYTTALDDPEIFRRWVFETHPELLDVNSRTRTKFIRENFRDKGVPIDELPPGLRAGERELLQVRGIKPTKTQEN